MNNVTKTPGMWGEKEGRKGEGRGRGSGEGEREGIFKVGIRPEK